MLCVLVGGLVGCNDKGTELPKPETKAPAADSKTATPAATAGLDKLSGSITIDGSSTVAPITKAAADKFSAMATGVRISVAEAGTGAGMKKFISKEIEVADASRPISKEELDGAAKAGIEVVEIPVAYDGLTVVVNKKNDFVKTMSTEDLRKLWDEKSTIKKWKEINPAWPDTEIKLYGPTSSHGSFEYFTEAVVKTKKKCRLDYQACTDYSSVSDGVAADEKGLGYLGLAYYEQNKDRLNSVGVDSGKGPVSASKETILNGTYTPLSRPLMIYTTKAALAKPEVKAFLSFILSDEGQALVESKEVGYVKLPDSVVKAARERLEKGTTGSILSTATPGTKLDDLFK